MKYQNLNVTRLFFIFILLAFGFSAAVQAQINIVNEGGSTPYAVVDEDGNEVSRHSRPEKAAQESLLAELRTGNNHRVIRDGILRVDIDITELFNLVADNNPSLVYTRVEDAFASEEEPAGWREHVEEAGEEWEEGVAWYLQPKGYDHMAIFLARKANQGIRLVAGESNPNVTVAINDVPDTATAGDEITAGITGLPDGKNVLIHYFEEITGTLQAQKRSEVVNGEITWVVPELEGEHTLELWYGGGFGGKSVIIDADPDAEPTPEPDPTPDPKPGPIPDPGPTPDSVIDYSDRPELDEDGWTILEPSEDSRIIYVSSSEGDDNNDGLSPENPVKTIAKGSSYLRDGFPDWLKLKAGDTWSESFNTGSWFLKSGSGEDKYMVITSYGQGARPRIEPTEGTRIFSSYNVRNLAIVGINFECDPIEGNTTQSSAILLLNNGEGPTGNILLEDCIFHGANDNINIQGSTESGNIDNVVVRRNIIIDAYDAGNDSHSQGVFVNNVTGLLLEENVVDHNGYYSAQVSPPTFFNHNLYLSGGNIDTTVRRNIITRGASFALQYRAKTGRMDNNLLVRNPLGILGGGYDHNGAQQNDFIHVSNNVVMNATDMVNGLVRGMSYNVLVAKEAIWENNIALNRLAEGRGNNAGFDINDPNRTPDTPNVFRNNITWGAANDFPEWREAQGFVDTGIKIADQNLPHFDLEGNIQEGKRLRDGSEVTFVDPNRTLESYLQEYGHGNDFQDFIDAVRARPRGVWKPELSAAAINAYIRAGFTVVE